MTDNPDLERLLRLQVLKTLNSESGTWEAITDNAFSTKEDALEYLEQNQINSKRLSELLQKEHELERVKLQLSDAIEKIDSQTMENYDLRQNQHNDECRKALEFYRNALDSGITVSLISEIHKLQQAEQKLQKIEELNNKHERYALPTFSVELQSILKEGKN